ncbi:X-ray repair cross-complementing protein 5-like [Musca vetustissima]|uniref:X-ray repair cross-complementing protein 5-like n=1 Tax=Musca vetustissima TaxID=27455 RepID=UPI002AB6893D|nr:X-ray repair cross-complementing protein 5-like [Musca vetustissima]
MAYNKEYMILILDVRRTATEDFKEKATKCCSDIIKRKICSGKKDYLSFVLVGTDRTYNDVNTNDCHDGYLNIVQYAGELQMPSWQLLMNFYQFVNETPSECGEWLDALVVAYGMLKKGKESAKFQRQRLVLFYDFNDGCNSYDSYSDITETLLSNNVDLIVVSPDICYIDNPDNDYLPQAIFASGKKSAQRIENEKYALRLVSECNATLCNFNEAVPAALRFKNNRPWCWNSQLRIGSKIVINISGVITTKDETTIKLKTVWNEPDEVLIREWGYFLKGNEVEVDLEELMDGYMLGGSAIPYDDSMDDDKLKLAPGLTFMGFMERKHVHNKYFAGESTYLILHRRGMKSSAQRLDALVRALLEADRVILCWKVYGAKSKPHIVVLIPNEIEDNFPASLNMMEMAHHSQYHFFEFPRLSTERTDCSKEQLNAIDNLIDSMDLTLKIQDAETPRNTFEKNALPFSHLPHIFEQNFMDLLERKILCKAGEDDEQFQEMLKDKNFVEAFWKIPEAIEEKAKAAAKEVKKLFPLEVSEEWLKQLKAHQAKLAANQQLAKNLKEENNNNTTKLPFDKVGSKTPAEDFEKLLKAHVFPIQDSTQRDLKFNQYALQLRSVVKDLIFKTESLTSKDFDKITAAISVYRKRCFIFNAFDEYNKWIVSIKSDVAKRHLSVFWNNVICKHELGLCFIGEPSLDEQMKEKDFYSLEFTDNLEPKGQLSQAELEMNDSEVDAMLANMDA